VPLRFTMWLPGACRLATVWSWEGATFSTRVPVGREVFPASYTLCTRSLSRGQSGRSVVLTTHQHLEPRLKKGYSYNLFVPPRVSLCAFIERFKAKFIFTLTPRTFTFLRRKPLILPDVCYNFTPCCTQECNKE
jgi:hypothetical protein